MNKYIVISSNQNPDYEFYVPIAKWAWKQFGWETICLRPFALNGFREETITQCIRLYAANYLKGNPLLMTSDADMIPLSDYWNPDPARITTYGHDLTGYVHYPMCYISMTADRWRDVMNLTGDMYADMKRDLENSKAKSLLWSEWWQVDQDIIAERLNEQVYADGWEIGKVHNHWGKHKVMKVDRGVEPGSHLPMGRVDRAGMKWTADAPIDFHAPKKPELHREEINDVLTRVFGVKYQKSWICKYVNEPHESTAGI